MGEIIAILVFTPFLRELERITKMGEGASAAIAILRLVEASRILTVGKPTGKCYVVSH